MASKRAKRARMRSRKKRKHGRSLRVERLEGRRLLAADMLHNAFRPADINDDGVINPLDVMMAIERLRTGRGSEAGNSFYDVNNDGRFNVADPLGAVDSFRRSRRGPPGRS